MILWIYHRITLEEGGCTAESLCSFSITGSHLKKAVVPPRACVHFNSITGSHLKKAVVPPKACVHFIIKSYISQEEDISWLSMREIIILATFNLSSAIAFNLVMSKILSFGKGLTYFSRVMYFMVLIIILVSSCQLWPLTAIHVA